MWAGHVEVDRHRRLGRQPGKTPGFLAPNRRRFFEVYQKFHASARILPDVFAFFASRVFVGRARGGVRRALSAPCKKFPHSLSFCTFGRNDGRLLLVGLGYD